MRAKEQLLHYAWKHRMFPLAPLVADDGQEVDVIDAGLHNSDAGPDFFNAKVKIGDVLWVGNVELHVRSSDWYAHGHDRDAAYDNVVLHVAEELDGAVRTHSGRQLPQLRLAVPEALAANYERLLQADRYPPCYEVVPELAAVMTRSWMAALVMERLKRKTDDVRRRVERAQGDWEAAFFCTLARNFGFGVNSDAFEEWAAHIPLRSVAHHRDSVFQVEAIFLGQAGLLGDDIPERHREAAEADGYFRQLRDEYAYLARKFGLTPMSPTLWRFLRLRPQNFPHVRIAQLACLYCARTADFADLIACDTPDAAMRALQTAATDYWQTHYTFGMESAENAKRLTKGSLRLLVVNTVAPVLFAYARYAGRDELQDRALDFLDTLPAENNHIVRMWRECGLEAANAADTQALIQLKKEYCDRKDCLRCRIGYEYLSRRGKARA